MDTTTTAGQDLADVLRHIERVAPALEQASPRLLEKVRAMQEAAGQPGAEQNHSLRTGVAQALQDVERLGIGPVLPYDHALRQEMTERATTHAGVHIGEIRQLLARTAEIGDQKTVNGIRDLARDAASLGDNQEHPDVLDRAEHLLRHIGRADTAPDHATVRPNHDAAPPPPEPERRDPRLHASPGGGQIPQDPHQPERSSDASPQTRTSRPSVADPETPGRAEPTIQDPFSRTEAGPQGAMRQTHPPGQSPESDKGKNKDKDAEADDKLVLTVPAASAMSRLAAAFRPAPDTTERPIDPAWIKRLKDFETQGVRLQEEQVLDQTAKAGQRVKNAFEALRSEPASTVMAEFSDAARNHEHGAAGVIAEMKEGGRYAGLHAAIQKEQGTHQAFAAQMQEASSALANYGRHREMADGIGARRPDQGEQISRRFAQMDADIHDLAGKVPGKEAGRSFRDEMSEKAREIAEKAVEIVRNLFGARRENAPSMGG